MFIILGKKSTRVVLAPALFKVVENVVWNQQIWNNWYTIDLTYDYEISRTISGIRVYVKPGKKISIEAQCILWRQHTKLSLIRDSVQHIHIQHRINEATKKIRDQKCIQ